LRRARRVLSLVCFFMLEKLISCLG
jgi:hypothetical protein